MRIILSVLVALLFMWCGNVMGMEIAGYAPMENTGYASVTVQNDDFYMQEVDNPALIIEYRNHTGSLTKEIVNITSEIFLWGWGWGNEDEARTRIVPLINTSETFRTGGRYHITSIELVGTLDSWDPYVGELPYGSIDSWNPTVQANSFERIVRGDILFYPRSDYTSDL